MKQISFLIGSGFSIPSDLPTTGDINDRLRKIKESEIIVNSAQDARFLADGEVDLNADHINPNKRKFVEKFIKFYNTKILSKGDEFHYEDFYDYYTSILNSDKPPDNYSNFLKKFIRVNKIKHPTDYLFNFNLTFNQLILNLIHKQFTRVSLCRPYAPICNAFLTLLDELENFDIIHLHSLNHDLYMEYLSQSDTMRSNFDDGFQEIGSPYYGNLNKKYERYTVRLPMFINKYEKKYRYYKLHGSINNYWFNEGDNSTLIRLKWGLGKTDACKEVNENGILKYHKYPLYFHSDFLSGTTAKIERYDKGHYYPIMFKYFVKHLNISDYLIIIGYGFGDSKINEMIHENFNGKKIFVVDIKKIDNPILESHSALFIDGGVVDMDITKILAQIN
jgi:hypothetical protein